MKARKKPVVIDFYPAHSPIIDIQDWVESFGDSFENHFIFTNDLLKVKTLEGTSYDLTEDDMILRGVSGEYYPCKRDIFEKTYDVVS